MSRLRAFCRDTSGAVAVEFVLIAPFLLALLFGTVVLGYFIGVSHSVDQLAAGAARSSVAGLDRAEREALATIYLDEAGERYPLLIQDAVDHRFTFDEDSTAGGITVNIDYDIDGSLLDIANGFLGLDLSTIKGQAYVAY